MNPQDSWHGIYQITWIKGRHQLKAGVDFQRMKLNAFLSRNSGGQFVFDRTYTGGPNPAVTATNAGNGFATFLLGVPIAGAMETTPFMSLFQRYNSGYVQDDWRITNRLTLNLGYRYEYISPYGDKFSQIGRFNPNAVDPATGHQGPLPMGSGGRLSQRPELQYAGPAHRPGLPAQFQDGYSLRGRHL